MATSDVVLCACGSFSAAWQTERMSSCKAKGEEFLQLCRNERVSVRYGCTVTDAQSRPSMLRLRVFNRVECYRHPRRAPSRPADGCSAGGSCRCVALRFCFGLDLIWIFFATAAVSPQIDAHPGQQEECMCPFACECKGDSF